jgi:hypothetical protein
MAAKVQIYKLALQHLGDNWDIAAPDEDSTEAEQINLIYDDVRKECLRDHPWTFATAFVSPAKLSIAETLVPENFSFMFQYPSAAIKIVNITNPLGNDKSPIPFRVIWDEENGNDQVIITNHECPEFKYIFDQENTERYTPLFVQYLALKLAYYACKPLTGDLDLRRTIQRDAVNMMFAAKADDGSEGLEPEQSRDPDWLEERL